jgi:hypothetical protein
MFSMLAGSEDVWLTAGGGAGEFVDEVETATGDVLLIANR